MSARRGNRTLLCLGVGQVPSPDGGSRVGRCAWSRTTSVLLMREPFLRGSQRRERSAAGREGIEPSRRSFGGSPVTMTYDPSAARRGIRTPKPAMERLALDQVCFPFHHPSCAVSDIGNSGAAGTRTRIYGLQDRRLAFGRSPRIDLREHGASYGNRTRPIASTARQPPSSFTRQFFDLEQRPPSLESNEERRVSKTRAGVHPEREKRRRRGVRRPTRRLATSCPGIEPVETHETPLTNGVLTAFADQEERDDEDCGDVACADCCTTPAKDD
jgi:hypothetical protein